MINLISDTVTQPTPAMLDAMFRAKVGDDVFRADPTINALEEKVAKMFWKDAALFCPSGTMTNQIAIKMHTKALDEIICDHYSHVYQYETGGYAYNSGVAINPLIGKNGKINSALIEANLKGDYDWLPNSALVVLENSCNKGGGSFYTLDEIKPIRALCLEKGLKLHLDGARLFNVLVETGESCFDVGQQFDSISICISKGLGAPVGSLLIGNEADMKFARRLRKVMGGGMRQAGYLAAACIYALENHVKRLKKDNDLAKYLGAEVNKMAYVTEVKPVRTNIVIFDIGSIPAEKLISYLSENNILASAFGPNTVRLVTHLEITDQMGREVIDIMKQFNPV